jgi:hypothetical protein
MLGILVHGSNHFIVNGPRPNAEMARALVRQWSLIRIGETNVIPGWAIQTTAFREDLRWAVEVRNGEPRSPAVDQLLAELNARGVAAEVIG